jgi:hypothetical protein
MIPIVAPLSVVERYAPMFSPVFTFVEEKQFWRYKCGLLINENKTVEGINKLFIEDLMDQSTMNRFLTHSRFTVSELNTARLDFMQSGSETAFKQGESNTSGVLILDDTLLQHYGPKKEHASWLRDPHDQSYHWSHNLVNLHYSDDKTDYPVDFRLWEPADLDKIEAELNVKNIAIPEYIRERKVSDPSKWRKYLLQKYGKVRILSMQGKKNIEAVYKTKLDLAKEMVDAIQSRYPELDIPYAFDTWYTASDLLNHIGKVHKRKYVGTLDNESIVTNSENKQVPMAQFCAELIQKDKELRIEGKKPLFEKMGVQYKGKKEYYYAYCGTHFFQTLGRHKLVISFIKEDLSDSEPKFYISNKLTWRGPEILRIRRHRWPIEVYHEEGKAEGLNMYQLRKFDAIKKHIALVCIAYSMLKYAQHDKVLLDNLQWKPNIDLMSLPLWRRMLTCEALLTLINWVVQKNGGHIDIHSLAANITHS